MFIIFSYNLNLYPSKLVCQKRCPTPSHQFSFKIPKKVWHLGPGSAGNGGDANRKGPMKQCGWHGRAAAGWFLWMSDSAFSKNLPVAPETCECDEVMTHGWTGRPGTDVAAPVVMTLSCAPGRDVMHWYSVMSWNVNQHYVMSVADFFLNNIFGRSVYYFWNF